MTASITASSLGTGPAGRTNVRPIDMRMSPGRQCLVHRSCSDLHVTLAASVPLSEPATSPAGSTRVVVRPRQKLAVLWEPATRMLLVPLAVLSALSLAATAAAPMLVEHPLVLIALSPRVAFLGVA